MLQGDPLAGWNPSPAAAAAGLHPSRELLR